MKNLIIALLFMPIFCSAQLKIGQCHTDLVFGFDIGDRIGFERKNSIGSTYSYLKTFRVGTNIAYPVSRKWLLVSGIRFSTRLFREQNCLNCEILIPQVQSVAKTHDFFVEVPFTFRRTLSQNRRGNGYFMEGGIQFNIYVLTYYREKFITLNLNENTSTHRFLYTDKSFRGCSLSNNVAIGWENTLRNGDKYFIQMVGRVELIAANQDNQNAYHLGIETGFRF